MLPGTTEGALPLPRVEREVRAAGSGGDGDRPEQQACVIKR